jgi:hypothetical protein
MMLFASWIKHPFDVAVQCLHDADPRAQAMPVAPVLLDQISRQPGLLDDRGSLQDRDG